jgi:O-antigen/teichoic acid export membrane protein
MFFLKIYKLFGNRLGVDGAIFWSIFNRGLGILKGPFTAFFIVKYLTVQEQGLWYTFGSLGAMTMLVDLGFTQIISQFVSHEYANLKMEEGRMTGRPEDIDRFMSLIRFSVKFYIYIIFIASIILFILGYFYFKSESIFILLAWYLYTVIGGLGLFGSLLLSIYQGLDKITEIQKNMILSSLAYSLGTWIMLMLHFKIWALVIGSFLNIFVTLFLLHRVAIPLWKQIIKYKVRGKYHFFQETIPLQWRYAISFICSYLIVYLYVPSTFKLIGPVQAGQLGLSLSIITAVSGMANSWIITKVPKFNVLVAQKNYTDLDHLFKKSMTNGVFIQILLSFVSMCLVYGLNYFWPLVGKRFISFNLLGCLLFSQIPQFFITALSLYLRAFKREPFMILLVLNALLMLLSIFLFLYLQHNFNFFIYSISVVNWAFVLMFGIIIFNKKKKEFINSELNYSKLNT